MISVGPPLGVDPAVKMRLRISNKQTNKQTNVLSCRCWRLVIHEYVLSCFLEHVLKWERAIQMCLVGLGVLLCVLAFCLVFQKAS